MSSNVIYKGDNTGFGGNKFITFYVKNLKRVPLSRVEFVVNSGQITKKFTDAENFLRDRTELTVNFNSAETSRLQFKNVANVVVYDTTIDASTGDYQQATCPQSLSFNAINGVISNVCRCK